MVERGFKQAVESPEPSVEGFEFYLDAFSDLSTCRPGGMDLLPIPFTAIVEYSRLYDVGEFEEFRAIIQMMDNQVLRLHQESNKLEQAGKNANTNANAGNKNIRGHKGK